MQGLIQGDIDIGLMYTPENRPGLGIEYLFDEQLQLVTTEENGEWQNERYVHIDWGPEFEAQFITQYPEAQTPALLANVGWLGVQQLLHSGGSGFFPLRMTEQLIKQGRFWAVPGSPIFELPVYLVYPLERQDEAMTVALHGLRKLGEELHALQP